METIKFRAWDKINKIWIKDFLITPEQDVLIIGEYETIKSGLTNGWKSSDGNVELQQFTGLKDKNGKEIYEGDIVKCFDGDEECGIGDVKFGTFMSSHEAGCSRYHYHQGFYIANKDGQVWDSVDEDIVWSKVEVIGNIHENPELN